MPYRGRLSKGCENCRREKRGCDLSLPSCLRCKRSGKTCLGYRDPNVIRILDETDLTRLKFTGSEQSTVTLPGGDATPVMKHDLSQIATSHFFKTFAVKGSEWEFLRESRSTAKYDDMLEYAMQACGFAAFSTTGRDPGMHKLAIATYGETMSRVQEALQDPHRCRSDSVLVTVALLGCYENVLCHDDNSVRSWRTHTGGTSQLLKLRGKTQLETAHGRTLYRLLRKQVVIDCVWDDLEPPQFLLALDGELQKYGVVDARETRPTDELHSVSLQLARLRSEMRTAAVSKNEALKNILVIRQQLDDWPSRTEAFGKAWQHDEIQIESRPAHVWNGLAYVYSSHAVASAWNYFRVLTMMVSRARELLSESTDHVGDDVTNEVSELWETRRQITNAICSAVPYQLTGAPTLFNRTCAPLMAYEAIWPLFFAASEALGLVEHYVQRVHQETVSCHVLKKEALVSARQALWLINRLDCISNEIGVKWADHFLAVLWGEHSSPFLAS